MPQQAGGVPPMPMALVGGGPRLVARHPRPVALPFRVRETIHLKDAVRVTLITALAEVRRLTPEIDQLLVRAGRSGDLTLSPEYYLARLRGYGRQPLLAAVRVGQRLEGVVYGMEAQAFGYRLGYVTAGDACGEGAILAEPEREAAVVAAAVRQWTQVSRIHTQFLRSKLPETTVADLAEELAGAEPGRVRVQRTPFPVRNHLTLAPNFDAFLAGVGYHTRRNLRYYRRHGEARGWRFCPDLAPETAVAAMVYLAPRARHAPQRRHWRYFQDVLQSIPGAHFAGLCDAEGQWLSLIATWRRGECCTVLLQLNAARYQRESVSTILRSYFIERMIDQGVRRLVFLGGCSTGLGRFTEPETGWNLRLEPARPGWDAAKMVALGGLRLLRLRCPLQRLALVASAPGVTAGIGGDELR